MSERVPTSPDEARSLARVFREEGAFVLRTIRRLGATPSDAEDLTQQVFVVLHRRPELLESIARGPATRAVLFGILRRVLADHRKAQRRARRSDEVEVDAHVAVPPAQERSVRQSEARRQLDAALARLDDDKREVLVLYELEELSMPEVARVLGVPVQTAYTRLHAAREIMRKALSRQQLAVGAPSRGTP